MADREIIIREKLTHEGIFDFSALYSYAHAWFQEEQYNGVDEERYSEKVSGNKRNLLIESIKANKTGRYLNFEIIITNKGLKDSSAFTLNVYSEDNSLIKEFEIGEIKIGAKRKLSVDNLQVPRTTKSITFKIENIEEELSIGNNEVRISTTS